MQVYSGMVSHLTDLTQSSKAWQWTNKCSEAFEKVKYNPTHAFVLWMPDFSEPFEVMGYASKCALATILMQDGWPIAFDTRKFNKAKLKCTVTG